MYWFSHITITTSLAYLCFQIDNPILLGVVGFGAIFPDWIEGPSKKKVIPHRTLSHSVFLWSMISLFLFIYCNKYCVIQYKIICEFTKTFLLGVWGHLIEDSINITGIPILFKKRRIAFKLFHSGHVVEYIVAWCLIIFIFLKNFYF